MHYRKLEYDIQIVIQKKWQLEANQPDKFNERILN